MDPLTDCPVPPAPPASSGIAWLRSAVARFCDGPEHERRRRYATDLLAGVEPAGLAEAARAEAAALLDAGGSAAAVARVVPVRVLGRALGVPDDLTARVADAARAYQPHHDGGPDAETRADAAVEALAAGDHGEPAAARIGLLVQACDATAGLIGAAARLGSVEAALRDDPPVRQTRRVRDGAVAAVDLTARPFGAGPHRCPGRGHAGAGAAAVLDVLDQRSSRP